MRIDEGNDSDPRGRGGGRIETSLCNSPRQHSRLLPGLQLGEEVPGDEDPAYDRVRNLEYWDRRPSPPEQVGTTGDGARESLPR
jgi:hypothetical protein